MKLLFKQRLFSWLDSYDVFDEDGRTVYKVQGKLAWGHCLEIYDPEGTHLGTVRQEILTFMPRFRIYVGENMVGEVWKKLTFLRPSFEMDVKGWIISGDIMSWDYTIQDRQGGYVAGLSKQLFHLTDTYVLDIENPEDGLYVLMAALAIDAAKCSSGD